MFFSNFLFPTVNESFFSQIRPGTTDCREAALVSYPEGNAPWSSHSAFKVLTMLQANTLWAFAISWRFIWKNSRKVYLLIPFPITSFQNLELIHSANLMVTTNYSSGYWLLKLCIFFKIKNPSNLTKEQLYASTAI